MTRLRARMDEKGLTLADVARRADLAASTVWRAANQRSRPTMTTRQKIAAALFHPTELWGGYGELWHADGLAKDLEVG